MQVIFYEKQEVKIISHYKKQINQKHFMQYATAKKNEWNQKFLFLLLFLNLLTVHIHKNLLSSLNVKTINYF